MNSRYFLILILFLSLSCGKSDVYFSKAQDYLETENLPLYLLRLPYYGINGRNGLEFLKNDTLIYVEGIYVKGMTISFLRTFSDSGLYYIPLENNINYESERNLIKVRGKVTFNGEPYLSLVEVKSFEEVRKLKDMVEEKYPALINQIKGDIHNPGSKLDLESIKSWHCACSDSLFLVYGRTYDLMYEFDIGILFRKEDDIYVLKKIYAREFFKGE